MTSENYQKNIARLKEIESIVKNPESSIDGIDTLIDEAKRLRDECLKFTRELREKIDTLADI